MAKTSMFSFTRSWRNKRGHEKDASELERRLPNSSLPVAETTTSLKAERILGETVSFPYLPLPASFGLDVPLHLKPSLSSLTPSVSSPDDCSTILAAQEYGVTRKGPTLLREPSLTVVDLEDPSNTGSDSSICCEPLHLKRSSSTLHSFYEPHTSPLSISQQTSESSARDMALRKGEPTVAQRLASADPDISSKAGEISPHGMKKVMRVSVRRKRPVLDMMKLFPKPFTPGGALLSPNKFVNSPSMLSETSEYFLPELTIDNDQQRKHEPEPCNSKIVPEPPASHASLQRRSHYKTQGGHQINVRRTSGGIQHWFESLAGVDDEDLQLHLRNQPRPNLAAEPEGMKKRSVSDPLRRNPVDANDLRMDYNARIAAAPHIPTPVSEQYATNRRISVMSNHSVQSRRTNNSLQSRLSRLADVNLEETSVLCTSSSEDDESDVEPPELSDGPSVSDTYGSEDLLAIPEAQQDETRPEAYLKPKDSRMPARETYICIVPESPSNNHRGVHFSESASLEVPKHLAASKSRRQTKVASKPFATAELNRSASYIASRKPSHESSDAFSRLESKSRNLTPLVRIMAVSEEEEALLGMIRSRRAKMKQELFTEAYQHALEEELDLAHRGSLRKPDEPELEQHPLHSLNADCFPLPLTSVPPSLRFDRVDRTPPRNLVRRQTSPEASSRLEVGDAAQDHMSSSEIAAHRHHYVHSLSHGSPTRPCLLSPVSTRPPLTGEISASRWSSISRALDSPAPVIPSNTYNTTRDHRRVSFKVETHNTVCSQQRDDGRVHNIQSDGADREYSTHGGDGSKSSSILVLDDYNGSGHVRSGTPVKRPLYRQRLDSVKEDVLEAWADLGGRTGLKNNRMTMLC